MTGGEVDSGRDRADDLGNRPDQVAEVAVLPELAVDAQPDLAAARVADVGDRMNRRARGGGVEPLGPVPRPAELLGLVLQIAAGQVDADAVAPDQAQSIVRCHVAASGAQRHHELDLVVERRGQRRVGDDALGNDHRVGRLHEEERRLPVRILAHLARVGRVVAPHAEHPPDRKAPDPAADG
ncbi:hypothetical protein A5721_05110 [Mycobacterium vulneris]|nr:hypothetical protein A5721_05110 [Mycolicibacterium vulneris]